MEPKKKESIIPYIILCTGIYLFVLFYASHMNIYMLMNEGATIIEAANNSMSHVMSAPFDIFPLNKDLLFTATLLYIIIGLIIYAERGIKVDMPGKESGSAKWFNNWKLFREKYVDPTDETNMILSNEVKLTMNTKKTFLNNNQIVLGGSGTGKSRYVIKPNILQANCSFVITDPKGELLETQAHHLEQKGYKIKCFNIIDMARSSHYNPFCYLENEKDVAKLVECFIKNTTGTGKGGDQFWVDCEKNILQACIFYLFDAKPASERNFYNVLQLIKAGAIQDEEDPDLKSPLDEMMDALRAVKPESMAFEFYDTFKLGAGKTAKSILISAATRLQKFAYSDIKNLTGDDTLDMSTIGDEKQALFVVIPASDTTFNFLVSMMYTQLFDCLYNHAAKDCKGQRLPVHVRFLLDEFANIGEIPEFPEKLSTMRGFEISCTIVLQSISQLKAKYKDHWETIIDNCSSIIFLGGQAPGTLEFVNKKLGKATIKSKDSSRTYGVKGSTSTSWKHEGRDLMTVAELSNMKSNKCIVFISGLDPFMCTKFDLLKHKNYKYSGDADKKALYKYDPTKHQYFREAELASVKNNVSTEDKTPMTSEQVEELKPEILSAEDKENLARIQNAVDGEDVNIERIQREKELAERSKSREIETTDSGVVCNKFKPTEEVVDEIIIAGVSGEITIDGKYDPNYEFRTNRPMKLDLNSWNFGGSGGKQQMKARTSQPSRYGSQPDSSLNSFEEPDSSSWGY